MKHNRQSLMFVAALLVGLASTPASAISPWAILVYSGSLGPSTLLRPGSPADFPAFGLLWWKAGPYAHPTRTVRGDPELVSSLKKRPYVSLAIFWGQYDAEQLKPENASQHGRFYPPTASEPAIVVSTVPDMQKKANPIPSGLEGFAAAWTLSPQELATLEGLGFPGLLVGHGIARRQVGDHLPQDEAIR